MKHWLALAWLVLPHVGSCQFTKPSERRIDHVTVDGASRLAALAKVGAVTGTTLLVEMGDLELMRAPVTAEFNGITVRGAIQGILGPAMRYTLRNQGALLVVSTSRVRDRMLDLPLRHLAIGGSTFSSFDPSLAEAIREASGCKPMGTAWAGFELPVEVPVMPLGATSFEGVVARFADSRDATMWIVETKTRPQGCIDNPAASWEVGVYGFGTGFSTCQMPFQAAAGPPFLDFTPKVSAFPEDCRTASEPNRDGAPPTFPRTTSRVTRGH